MCCSLCIGFLEGKDEMFSLLHGVLKPQDGAAGSFTCILSWFEFEYYSTENSAHHAVHVASIIKEIVFY